MPTLKLPTFRNEIEEIASIDSVRISFIFHYNTFDDILQQKCRSNDSQCLPFGIFYTFNTTETCNTAVCLVNSTSLILRNSLWYFKHKGNIKVGVEYTNNFLESCSDFLQDFLRTIDFAILKVNNYPSNTLSFSSFKTYAGQVQSKNLDFLKQARHWIKKYVRLSAEKFLQTGKYKKYTDFISVLNHIRKTAIKELYQNYVIESIPSTVDNMRTPNCGKRIENFTLYIDDSNMDLDYSRVECAFSKIMQVIGKDFRRVILVLETSRLMTTYKNIFSTCNETEFEFAWDENQVAIKREKATSIRTFPTISMVFDVRSVDLTSLENVLNITSKLYKRGIVYINMSQPEENPETEICEENICSSVNNVVKYLDTQFVPKGCYYGFTANAKQILDRCKSLFTGEANLLLVTTVSNYTKLNENLHQVFLIQQQFLEAYPHGKFDVILKVSPAVESYKPYNTATSHWNNAYCREAEAHLEFYDEVLSWALQNNVSISLQRAVNTHDNAGFWYNIETVPELNRSLLSFPVLARRYFQVYGQVYSNVYPCIAYMDARPTKFGLNFFAGITLNVNNTSPPPNELRAMLLVAYGKFFLVDIQLSQVSLETVKAVVTGNFVRTISDRSTEVGEMTMYLQSENIMADIENMTKLVDRNGFLKLHLHFSNWEFLNTDDILMLQNTTYYMMKQGFVNEVGLTINDCIHEANLNFSNLRGSSIIKHVNFVVCQMKSVYPSTENRTFVQLYLDTIFYLHQLHKTKFDVRVVFRLNLKRRVCNATTRAEVKNYLSFSNDVIYFLKSYKIRYFLGNAFGFASNPEEECKWGWWNVSGDLQTMKSYTEHESDYNGKETYLRFSFSPPISPRPLTPIIAGSITAVLAIGVSMAAVYYWRYKRFKKMILTKEEVRMFRYPTEVHVSEELADEEHLNVSSVKTLAFNPKFEVSKQQIELEYVIGRGNFGVVYRGVLNKTKAVAVKIPTENCSVDSFKTMLAEIKILCHVSDHANIVCFLGAYTCEIEFGVVYVIMEICEEGSLEAFLRKIKKKLQAPAIKDNEKVEIGEGYVAYVSNPPLQQSEYTEKPSVDLSQLRKFCYEICLGMNYISSKNIVHSDLSSRNVLLTKEQNCKICDFGLARKLYSYKYLKKGDEALPWRWMAIESLKNMEFTTKSDVWSFGVTMWEIFSLGEVPYPGVPWDVNFCKALENGLRLSQPDYSTDKEYEIMLSCWNENSVGRADFQNLSEACMDLLVT